MRFFVLLAFLLQSLVLSAAEEAEDLRMGFNHGRYSLWTLFPKECSLQYQETSDGIKNYHATALKNGKSTRYQFSFHGYGLQGLITFKDEYLEKVKAAFKAINPNGNSRVTMDQKEGTLRAVVNHVGKEGKRLVFVGDFFSLESKVYVVSETIEIADGDTREAQSIIDEAFFNSFTLEKK